MDLFINALNSETSINYQIDNLEKDGSKHLLMLKVIKTCSTINSILMTSIQLSAEIVEKA